jgi:probable phosphoglycerate mutase
MEAQNTITRFGLLRHGKTEWNQTKRIQGQEDSPLIPEARQKADQWGNMLIDVGLDRIISSDLGRAMETATLINQSLGVPMIQDHRLREQDWGRWTGKTLMQLKEKDKQRLTEQVEAGWNFCPPEGEDRRSVLERSQAALLSAGRSWAGETILVVTHEGVIKSLIYHLSGRKFLPSEPRLISGNQIHWLYHDTEGIGITKINALDLS